MIKRKELIFMGYTHYFEFNGKRGNAKRDELNYQRAIKDCQRIIKRFSLEHGGLAGYSAHTKLNEYGGINVNGSGENACEAFSLREHFNENSGDFVKTNQLPYDIVVVACLAVLKHRLGDAVTVKSDGRSTDFVAGITLARNITKLAIKENIESIRK